MFNKKTFVTITIGDYIEMIRQKKSDTETFLKLK